MFSVPEFIAHPEVTPLSPTTLTITWNTTEGHGVIARGQVTEYRVNLVTEQSTHPYAPPVINQVAYIHIHIQTYIYRMTAFLNNVLEITYLLLIQSIVCVDVI